MWRGLFLKTLTAASLFWFSPVCLAEALPGLQLWTLETMQKSRTETAKGTLSDTFLLQISPHALLKTGSRFQVPLPGSRHTAARLISSRRSGSGGRQYEFLPDEPRAGFSLHIGLNAIFGRINTRNDSLIIEPHTGGGSLLRKAGKLPAPDLLLKSRKNRQASARKTPAGKNPLTAENHPQEAEDGRIDFLYFYDQSMIETYGWGLADLAATEVSNLQTALERSRVPLEADLTQLAFMDVPYERGTDYLIDDLDNRDGFFSDFQQKLDALDVDIISLNREYDPGRDAFCGLVFGPQNPLTHINGRIQAVVCHNDLVLAHETGHNLGLGHGTDGTAGLPVVWARGFRLDDPGGGPPHFTSVMATGAGRNMLFSDPTVPCPLPGSVCGIPTDPNNPLTGADAALSLRMHAKGPATRGRPNLPLLSSVLPGSRFVATGGAATAFLSAQNPNQLDGTDCVIEHHGPYRENFTFRATEPGTNAATGEINQPVTIPAGELRTFIISLTPLDDLPGVQFAPFAACENIPMAKPVQGLNTLALGADLLGGPDLIAIARTPSENGIVEVPPGEAGVFVVASSNLGGSARVTVSARSLDPELPATGLVCQTDPESSACMNPRAKTVTLDIEAGGTPTFAVFVRTEEITPFLPEQRFALQMHAGGQLRGATSVAVRSLPAKVAGAKP